MCRIFSSLDREKASSQILSYLEISSWRARRLSGSLAGLAPQHSL